MKFPAMTMKMRFFGKDKISGENEVSDNANGVLIQDQVFGINKSIHKSSFRKIKSDISGEENESRQPTIRRFSARNFVDDRSNVI